MNYNSLSKRVGRILAGSVNALIDTLEDSSPGVVMEQSIREITEAIAEIRTQLGKEHADKHNAAQKLAQLKEKHADLADKTQVALENAREDLAKAAIAAQMDLEDQYPALEAVIKESEKTSAQLEEYITALKAKLSEMKSELASYAKANSLADQVMVPDGSGTPNPLNDVMHKIDDAITSFENASGSSQVGDDQSATLRELDALARQSAVEKRLAAAKADTVGDQ